MTDEVNSSNEPTERPAWLARLRAMFGMTSDPTLRDSIEAALETDDGPTSGFSDQERLMLNNILGFRAVRIDDVMVPRADIIAVEQSDTIGNVMAIFRDAGHSRLPVYRDTLDEPLGMVHIKDLLGWITHQAKSGNGRRKSAKNGDGKNGGSNGAKIDFSKLDLRKPLSSAKILRTALFVPPSMPAVELLLKMQATRLHLALVVDEYGGTEGLVSIEDLVEEIVGEIEDEHDVDQTPKIVKVEDGLFEADARVLIEDFRNHLDDPESLVVEEEEADTLGGLVFALAGRIPVRGELIDCPQNFEIEVLDADQRRIRKLRVRKKDDNSPLDNAAGKSAGAANPKPA